MSDRKLGPNLKKLLIIRMARESVPPGTTNPMATAIESLKNASAIAKLSLEWCDQAIAAIRSAPDNPYGDDEEVIAGAILENLEEK